MKQYWSSTINSLVGYCPKQCWYCTAQKDKKRVQRYGSKKWADVDLDSKELKFYGDAWKVVEKKSPEIFFVNILNDTFNPLAKQHLETQFKKMSEAKQHTFLVCTKFAKEAFEWISEHKDLVTPNIYIGFTIENTKAVYDRFPYLLSIADLGIHTWISAGPLCEDISFFIENDLGKVDFLAIEGMNRQPKEKIVKMDLQWAENLRLACEKSGTRFFFKGKGDAYKPNDNILNGEVYSELPGPNKNKK